MLWVPEGPLKRENMKTQTIRFRPNLVFQTPLLIVCTLAITLASCSREKPPSENDGKMAVQYYLLGTYGDGGPGLSEGRNLADKACSSEFNSNGCGTGPFVREWVGSVKEVARVTEIGASKKEDVLTERTNRYGVSSWDTDEITVWPVKVQLILECICRDRTGRIQEVPARTVTTTQEYKLHYDADSKKHWSVRH